MTFYIHEQALQLGVGSPEVMFIDAENHGVHLDDKDSIEACSRILKSLDQTALDVNNPRS